MGKLGNLSGKRIGKSQDHSASVASPVSRVDVREHLNRDLARVRSKFGMDPPAGTPPLTAAWMTDAALEEDESEFVDTLADCLGAGLSLQDALSCWDTGDLAADDDDLTATDDEVTAVGGPVDPRPPRRTGGHRVVVR